MSLLTGFQCLLTLLCLSDKARTTVYQPLIIWSLTASLIFSLRGSHTGLLVVPQLGQAHTYLRVFTKAVPSAWDAPLPTSVSHFLQVSAQIPLPRQAVPSLTILYKIAPSCCQFLAPFLLSIFTTYHLIYFLFVIVSLCSLR